MCVQLTFYYASNSKGFFRKIIRHSRLKAASEKKSFVSKKFIINISQLFDISKAFVKKMSHKKRTFLLLYLSKKSVNFETNAKEQHCEFALQLCY